MIALHSLALKTAYRDVSLYYSILSALYLSSAFLQRFLPAFWIADLSLSLVFSSFLSFPLSFSSYHSKSFTFVFSFIFFLGDYHVYIYMYSPVIYTMFREDFVPSTCNKFYSIFCLCPTLDPSTFNRSLSLSFAPCLSVFLSPFPSPSRHSLGNDLFLNACKWDAMLCGYSLKYRVPLQPTVRREWARGRTRQMAKDKRERRVEFRGRRERRG